MRAFHLWLFEIVRPRSFTLVTTCIGLLLIVTALKESADLEKLICNSSHLVSINWNLSVSACLTSSSMATWIPLGWPVWTVSAIDVSSMYFQRLMPLTLMSFIMTRKSQGPSLVPYGTPALTDPQFKKQSWVSFTRCFLSVRKSAIQSNTQGGSP